MEKNILTTKEVSDRLQLNIVSICEAARNGAIKSLKLNSGYVFNQDDINKIMKGKSKENYISCTDAAKKYHIHQNTLSTQYHAGKIKGYQLQKGSNIFLDKESLHEWVNNREQKIQSVQEEITQLNLEEDNSPKPTMNADDHVNFLLKSITAYSQKLSEIIRGK